MKKYYLILVVTILTLNIQAQTNLVKNPSFEEWDSFDTNPKDWGRWLSALWHKSSEATDGNSSVELETSCNSGCSLKFNFIFNSNIDLEANKTYTISASYKVTKGSFNKLDLEVRRSIFDISEFTTNDIDNTWKTFSIDYTPSADETINFYIQAFSDNEEDKILIDNVKIIDKSTLSSDKLELANTIIAPNPISDNLTIDFGNDYDENLNIEIYTTTGQLISKKEKLDAKEKINLSNLKSGIYLLKVANHQKYFVKKIVKI